MKFNKKTDKELKILAEALYSGHIYSDRNFVREEDSFDEQGFIHSFPILRFMTNNQLEDLKDVGLIYGYFSEAAPLSVNGRPVFFSVHTLSKEDTQKMFEYYQLIFDFHKELLKNE